MNNDDTRTVTGWPGVATLREQVAELAWRTAQRRQADTGWSDEETVLQVEAAAIEAVDGIALALVEAVQMGLDLWETTR